MTRARHAILLLSAYLSTLSIVAVGEEIKVTYDERDGLIAWYPFDKGVVDRTGNIEPIEGESILPVIAGKFGGAVKLDGDTFIAIPIDLGPDLVPSITISLWVKTDPRPADAALEKSLPSTKYIVSESIGVSNLNGDSAYFFGEAFSRAIVGPKHTTRRGQWQHVAVVRTIEDRPNADGEIEPYVVSWFHSGGRMSELVVPFRGQGMATDLYLGTNSPRHPSRFRFRGALDELRVYDRALSKDEVELLAKVGAAQPSFGVPSETQPGTVAVPPAAGISPLDGESGVNPAVLPDSADNVSLPTYDDNRDAATPVTTLPVAGDNPSIVPPNETVDDFRDRVDDPEFQDSLKAVDWNVKGMIPLTQEEKANIYPGSTVTVKIRVDKDDPANKIPDVKLAIKGAQSSAEAVPLRVMTSEQVPTARRDIPMTVTIPSDFNFENDGQIGTYYADTWLLTANGFPLQDTITDNNSRRLSIQVQRPLEVEDCGVAMESEDGMRTTTGCLESAESAESSRFYIDHSVLVFAESPFGESHENDPREVLVFESRGLLQQIRIEEKNDKPCAVTIGSKHTNSEMEAYHCAPYNVIKTLRRLGLSVGKDEAITGISVCRNAANNRLKGIGINHRRIKDDGSFAPSTEYKKDDLTNCAPSTWTPIQSCQPGAAAAGIRLVISPGSSLATRDFIHSIDLACGEVKVREDI